jgi:hypothetical protein
MIFIYIYILLMEIIKELQDFYKTVKNTAIKNKFGMWDNLIVPNVFVSFENNLIENNLEKCKYDLENISSTHLTYGYDLTRSNGSDSIDIIYKTFKLLLDEMSIDYIIDSNGKFDLEAIFPTIDQKIGFKLDFPEVYCYSANAALNSTRGNISSRMVYALLYVWNIKQNIDNVKNASILEIGAGCGRTAYFAYKFGFKKYSIIDIISTNIVQYHFCYNILGKDKVSLGYNNSNDGKFLHILNNGEYESINEQYDIICNFDGLTEYGINNATDYFNKFCLLTKKVLSINHTTNEYTFTDLYRSKENIKLISKEKYDYRIDMGNLEYYKEIIEFTDNK